MEGLRIMITNYYTYDKDTLEVDHTPKRIIRQSGMDELPIAVLLVEPLEPAQGKAVLVCDFDNNGRPQSTEYIPDYRGEAIYNTTTKGFKKVERLGDIEEGWTLKKPPTPYHTFNADLDYWELTAQAQATQRTDVIQRSITSIDNAAAAVASFWARFTTEYEESEKAAIEYKTAGYDGDASVFITSYADAAGVTYQQATDTILQQADGLRSLQASLRAERMRKYELKDPALTLDEITVLHDDIVANIKALGESYE